MFESLLADHSVKDILTKAGYLEDWRSGWNGWEGDEKRRGEVVVWTRRLSTMSGDTR